MIKKNKWRLLITSVIILLPILAGVILWDQLPEQLATHWGADGTADGYSSRVFAVFGLPVILLALHWFCILATAADKKNKGQNHKIFGIVLWIVPVLSLFANGIVYATAYGLKPDMERAVLLLIGGMFMLLGNYLPKCAQNYTIGIKVKWTLEDEGNWNATHRVGGRLWVIGGMLFLLCVFLPRAVIPWVLVVLLPVMAVIPVVYSYVYSRRQKKAGIQPANSLPVSKTYRRVGWVAMAIGLLLLLGMIPLLFTGEVQVTCTDTAVTVDATFYAPVTVKYADIDRIEYRPESDPGTRTMGFGSPRLLLGTFENEEFGSYTRYAYTRCPACVVLTVDGKVLVLSGKDTAATRNLYEDLMAYSGRLFPSQNG